MRWVQEFERSLVSDDFSYSRLTLSLGVFLRLSPQSMKKRFWCEVRTPNLHPQELTWNPLVHRAGRMCTYIFGICGLTYDCLKMNYSILVYLRSIIQPMAAFAIE